MAGLKPQHWKRLQRVFEVVGFRVERIRGDHVVMSRPGVARPIVLPRYRDVGADIILANLRTAGISRERYLEILKRC